MSEISALTLFAAALIFCIRYDILVLAALVFGFFLFFWYVCKMAAIAPAGNQKEGFFYV